MSDLVVVDPSGPASLDLRAGTLLADTDLVELGLPSAALHLGGAVIPLGHARSLTALVERCERLEEDTLSTLVARMKPATPYGERP